MCVCDLCIVFHHASYHRLYPRIQLRGEGGWGRGEGSEGE